jgi:hypothetical protein
LLGKNSFGDKGISNNFSLHKVGVNKLLLNPFSKNLDVYSYKTKNGKITSLKKEYDLNKYKKELKFEYCSKSKISRKQKETQKLIVDLLTEINKFYTKDGVSGIERMKRLKKGWDIGAEKKKTEEIKKAKDRQKTKKNLKMKKRK